MLCLSSSELYSRWVPLKFGEHPQEVRCMKGISELDGCHSATFKKWRGDTE